MRCLAPLALTLFLLVCLNGCVLPHNPIPKKESSRQDFLLPLESERITKKPFGLRVDPKNSPVNPERFSGYHTGADFEVWAHESDVQIRAACTGPIVLQRYVSGYGGVVVQRCTINGSDTTVLYGHVRLSSVDVSVGDTLTIGQTFAILGMANSNETDGERAHLHFGIHRGSDIVLTGYVQSQKVLVHWIDPLSINGSAQ